MKILIYRPWFNGLEKIEERFEVEEHKPFYTALMQHMNQLILVYE